MNSPKLAKIVFGVAIGLIVGVGGYTFIYAKGYSYLTNNPAACANCHIMNGQYDGWIKSSHHSVATCNDCHTPSNFIGKWAKKSSNGFWHSFAFTTGRFPENLQIKPHNLEVTEQACRDCHTEIVSAIDGPHGEGAKTSCVRCHASVGHLK